MLAETGVMKYDTNPKHRMIRSGNPEKQINILGKIEVPWKRFILTITLVSYICYIQKPIKLNGAGSSGFSGTMQQRFAGIQFDPFLAMGEIKWATYNKTLGWHSMKCWFLRTFQHTTGTYPRPPNQQFMKGFLSFGGSGKPGVCSRGMLGFPAESALCQPNRLGMSIIRNNTIIQWLIIVPYNWVGFHPLYDKITIDIP